MAATLLTISMITKEALMILENELGFTSRVNREYDEKFAVAGAKIGTTLNIRKPVSYSVSTGQALDLQEPEETQVALVLDTQNHVDFSFNSQDLLLSVDDFSARFLKPAISRLANEIDTNGLKQYVNIYNHIGTPGTTPTALLTYMQAKAKLDDCGAPRSDQRFMCVDPTAEITLVNAAVGYFNPQQRIAGQYTSGEMGTAGGLRFFMDQNVATHTTGAHGASTPVTYGTQAHGATSLYVDGWASNVSSLKKGDVLSLADVYAVKANSGGQPRRDLMQFVVTQDVSDSSGAMATINISPAIYLTGPKQNCYYAASTSAIADGVVVYVNGYTGSTNLQLYDSTLTPQLLAFHKDAFTLACADLPLPQGVDMAARVSDKQLGLSIRLIRQYDISLDSFPCRLDILYGWKTIRAELACRISS